MDIEEMERRLKAAELVCGCVVKAQRLERQYDQSCNNRDWDSCDIISRERTQNDFRTYQAIEAWKKERGE